MGRVLVKKMEPPTKSAGGIILPKRTKPEFDSGIVMAIGPPAQTSKGIDVESSLNVGDTVMLPNFSMNSKEIKEGDDVLLFPSYFFIFLFFYFFLCLCFNVCFLCFSLFLREFAIKI